MPMRSMIGSYSVDDLLTAHSIMTRGLERNPTISIAVRGGGSAVQYSALRYSAGL